MYILATNTMKKTTSHKEYDTILPLIMLVTSQDARDLNSMLRRDKINKVKIKMAKIACNNRSLT